MLANLTVKEFLAKTAGNAPVPGGGSIAALSAVIASALTEMVANLTIGKKKYEDKEEMMKQIAASANNYQMLFIHDIDADSDAYNNVFDAFKLPYQELKKNSKKMDILNDKIIELEALIAKLTKDNSDQNQLDMLVKELEVNQKHMQELLMQFYSQQQVSSIKKNFEFVIISLSNWPVQTLQKIFYAHFIPAHPSLQNHFPSESQCHSETTQIQMGIRKQLAEFLYELNELQILEQKLEHLAPQLRKVWYQNDDTDWEDIAKYARAGAMAVINPFVGIPFLAGKIFSDYKQETKVSETNTDFLSKWEELFNQYAEKWGHINEIFCAVQENLTLYIQDKSKRIVVGGTIHLLKIADKQGEQIKTPDHYFGSN